MGGFQSDPRVSEGPFRTHPRWEEDFWRQVLRSVTSGPCPSSDPLSVGPRRLLVTRQSGRPVCREELSFVCRSPVTVGTGVPVSASSATHKCDTEQSVTDTSVHWALKSLLRVGDSLAGFWGARWPRLCSPAAPLTCLLVSSFPLSTYLPFSLGQFISQPGLRLCFPGGSWGSGVSWGPSWGAAPRVACRSCGRSVPPRRGAFPAGRWPGCGPALSWECARGPGDCVGGRPSRARTLEAGKRWARLAQARAASRPRLCVVPLSMPNLASGT